MQLSTVFADLGQCSKSLSLWRAAQLLLLLQLVIKSEAQNVDSSLFYSAGVVEFRPTLVGTSSEILADHLNAYIDIITSPEANDLDIIVFPEGTLNNNFHLTYVPSPGQNIIPCLHSGNESSSLYADFFIQLSCTAQKVRKYLVINLTEKQDCLPPHLDPRPCATNGLNIFNTNVVFDREGRVISRYRKVNVYVENKNTTLQPEYAIFDTDFGVRFGHFICFDMLFYTPAEELVQRYGLTDFIFTSLFYSELPFLSATQLQQGWAWGNNVNLLAAGASFPRTGTTGTGIYSGPDREAMSVMVTSGDGERKLYKARVRKIATGDFKEEEKLAQSDTHLPHRDEQPIQVPSTSGHLPGIRLLKDPQIESFQSILLTNDTKIFEKICHDDFCCEFSIWTQPLQVPSNKTAYKYRMGVFSGSRTYEKDQRNNIKVCAIYTCRNEDPASCGELLESNEFYTDLYMDYIMVKGKFPKARELLIMPSTLDADLNPLGGQEVGWKNEPQKNPPTLSEQQQQPQQQLAKQSTKA
ncbi:vanin-like protein 1 [Musca vetustissima]|uniref:vanin-like protein 1 n=1 Tax=Musca vetustissima TaxID=27455 RepID=UPI002AB65E07|nr:vanin-like protein 1 [Musca vetustissima]